MNCVAVSSARCRWGGCCAWAAISAAASCFQWSVTGWGKLFPVQSSLVLGSFSSVEAFKHPPPPTLGPVVFALLLPATWGRVQREEIPTGSYIRTPWQGRRRGRFCWALLLSCHYGLIAASSNPAFPARRHLHQFIPQRGQTTGSCKSKQNPKNPCHFFTAAAWVVKWSRSQYRTPTLRSCAATQDGPDLHSNLLFHVSSEVILHSAAVMFTPSTVHHSPQGRRMSVDRSVSTVNRTPVWHKSRQQQCGCCMATKSLTRLCSICRMTRALLSPFLSHFPIYCPASPSLP